VDPKLTVLFLLIGAIIGFSHVTRENPTKMKIEIGSRRWLGIVPRWRK
jgi:hypothetical protein